MRTVTSIRTENLSIGYRLQNNGETVVHKGLNLELEQGELTCLLGLNGSGKSTLLRTLSGSQKPLSGHIYWMDKEISKYSDAERALMVGVVLTDKIHAGGLTVYELVALGRYPHTGFFGQLTANDDKEVCQAMEFTGISNMANRYYSELSDGERQKVLIAKALAQECPIILLDEPTAFLDINSRLETMSLLLRLTRIGKSILLSTHDIDLAIQMSDSIWMLDKEKDFVFGAPEDLILDGTFNRFFGKNGISMDLETGAIHFEHPKAEPIYVNAAKSISYWVNNALVRNGYRAVYTPEESDIHITVKEFPEMEIHKINDFTLTVYSMEELIRRMRLL